MYSLPRDNGACPGKTPHLDTPCGYRRHHGAYHRHLLVGEPLADLITEVGIAEPPGDIDDRELLTGSSWEGENGEETKDSEFKGELEEEVEKVMMCQLIS